PLRKLKSAPGRRQVNLQIEITTPEFLSPPRNDGALAEALAKPSVKFHARIQRRMCVRFTTGDVASRGANVRHPFQRPLITGRIVANLFQRNRGHRVAEQLDLPKRAIVLLFEGPVSFLPKIFVSEFVRDDATQLGLAGDEHKLRRDDEGDAGYHK